MNGATDRYELGNRCKAPIKVWWVESKESEGKGWSENKENEGKGGVREREGV